MNTAGTPVNIQLPRLWLALALLFWGYLTDTIAGAVVMALMLEGITLSPIKWNLGKVEFHRAADLTSVVFAAVTVVQFSRYGVHGIYQILAVLPYCFFPMVLIERASTVRKTPLSALFYSLRRYPDADRAIQVQPIYLVVCLLAATTTDAPPDYFVLGTLALLGGVLLKSRPQRYPLWHWLGVLILAAGITTSIQFGLERSRHAVEQTFAYWLSQFPFAHTDPNRARTAIGAIGRLKLSDQIRIRVKPSDSLRLPLLLQEASYDTFKFGSWSATGNQFEALDVRADNISWNLAEAEHTATTPIEISFKHRKELAVLPLPRASARIVSKEIAEIQQSNSGAVMAESPPGALSFSVYPSRLAPTVPTPSENDMQIPKAYQNVISEIGEEIGLDSGDATTKASRIREFFINEFKYSLYQRAQLGRRTALAHFLKETRRGHCEYFASAATLLLREAGIPARYAVGYVVENYSDWENAYIARARHAHAWALAYLDGQWVVVDATPSQWYELEDRFASDWQSWHDAGNWLWYRLQRLGQADVSELEDMLIWLVPPLAIVLYWRLRRAPTAVQDPARHKSRANNNDESPLKTLLQQLSEQGMRPQPGETMAAFFERAGPLIRERYDDREIIAGYYRYRFGQLAEQHTALQHVTSILGKTKQR